ncbi:MAG: hypothetical protein NTX31_03920 [Burkholderiales bacterium]|jgi:hypothetical protein|nr:hypothetical protein [Burkholderiales bacterium]
MSLALFAIPGALSPLHAWWRGLRPSPAPRPAARHRVAPAQLKLAPSVHKPLRVVRILEAGQAPTHVGRMTISGRMADVCAELDRLAALH